jgi:hypothetical protein
MPADDLTSQLTRLSDALWHRDIAKKAGIDIKVLYCTALQILWKMCNGKLEKLFEQFCFQWITDETVNSKWSLEFSCSAVMISIPGQIPEKLQCYLHKFSRHYQVITDHCNYSDSIILFESIDCYNRSVKMLANYANIYEHLFIYLTINQCMQKMILLTREK